MLDIKKLESHELPFTFSHQLHDEKLFSLESLANVATELSFDMIEDENYKSVYDSRNKFNKEILQRILNIEHNNSYIFIRNIEKIPAYALLMEDIISDISNNSIIKDMKIYNPMSYVFISSPNKKAPFHMDPEHNFLCQIRGEKSFHLANRKSKKLVTDSEISEFYKDEIGFTLELKDEYLTDLTKYDLKSGLGVYVPVTYPHFVENSNCLNISYSLTFRSEKSDFHRKHYLQL